LDWTFGDREIQPQPLLLSAAYARGPGFCCLCGQPVYRLGWHIDLPRRRVAASGLDREALVQSHPKREACVDRSRRLDRTQAGHMFMTDLAAHAASLNKADLLPMTGPAEAANMIVVARKIVRHAASSSKASGKPSSNAAIARSLDASLVARSVTGRLAYRCYRGIVSFRSGMRGRPRKW